MTMFVAGLMLGAAGSAHCVGMCGPLVLTLGRPLGRPGRLAHLAHALAYHAGRVAVYVVLAVPAGAAGEALAARGLGRALALGAAVMLAVFALGASGPRVFGPLGRWVSGLAGRASAAAAQWSQAHPAAGPLALGAANGLMPCGLVYAALGTAAASGSTAAAAWTMAGFGVGTAPVLVALVLSATAMPASVRTRLRKLAPVALLLTAALLAGRAFNAPSHAGHSDTAPPAAHAHH